MYGKGTQKNTFSRNVIYILDGFLLQQVEMSPGHSAKYDRL